MFINPAITVTVTGGSFEDNAQICNMVHNALRDKGMTNVTASESIAPYIDESAEMIAALRNLNPDIFDTPVVIAGQCEEDITNNDLASLLDVGSFVQTPQVWDSPFFYPSNLAFS